ncbi:MAG TPA: preprotein translocase subunit YajC [Bacteroidetes bacterium]|nr:preprotein translocase subunit YajC [Bacteroidota bacterium]
MNYFSMILATAQGGQQQQNPMMSLLFLVAIIVIFYLFMIRPQVKRQKDLKNYRESLKKGDRVITTGGIYGKITDVKDNTVTLEISDNIRVKVDKSAVLKDASDLGPQK